MPPRRAIDVHEARVEALREEARSGLASSDVRRTLIKEQLRPPPRLIPTPPVQPRHITQQLTVSSSTSATTAAATVSTTALNAEDSIPTAWLLGDFTLDALSSDVLPSSPTAAATSTKSSVSYQAAKNAYTSLCTVAQSVDYDVRYEEGLRNVEARDARSGLATSWITRRASAPLLGDPAIPLPRPRSTASTAARLRQGQEAASLLPAALSLYAPPPPSSAHGSVNASAPPSRASLYTAPAAKPSTSRSQHSSRVVAPPSPSAASTVGTAVMRSSAADFATSLRRRVEAQRDDRHGSGRLNSLTSAAFWRPSGAPGAEEEEGGEVRWRTEVTAAVALAVCSGCGALVEHTLDAPTSLCHRCGQAVVEATPQRWLLPPPSNAELAVTATAAAVRPPPPAHASSGAGRGAAATSSSSTGEGCGTDSVGFAAQEGEETFADLIARIRASKKAGAADTAVHGSTAAQRVRRDVSAGEGSDGTPSSAAMEAAVPVVPSTADPMIARLRAALSRPYFVELSRAAKRGGVS